MAHAAEFYRCELCGNLVAVLNVGGGELTCCGQAMTHLVAGSTDGAKEKHVPAITRADGKIKVAVGSVTHPMEEKHFIQWIALAAPGERLMIKYLKPGEAPEATFCEVPSGTVYEYCNLHGLWKTDF